LPFQALYERTQKCIQRGYSAIFEFFLFLKRNISIFFFSIEREIPFIGQKPVFQNPRNIEFSHQNFRLENGYFGLHSKTQNQTIKQAKSYLSIQIDKNLKLNRLKQNEIVSTIHDGTFGINCGKKKNAPKG